MKRNWPVLLIVLLCETAWADAVQVDNYQWEGVVRVVAVGDLHGDFDNYMATLRAAGLVDRKGKWSGGDTHFVQVGDLPDRGPDTLKIIEHIDGLARQAKRKGGRVHRLIGNHEVMNATGDVRYAHPGEFEAFKTRNSEALRERYFNLFMQRVAEQNPEAYAALPEDYRAQWFAEHPPGWLEHRQAWDFQWNPKAEYAHRLLDMNVAIRINDSLFVHGGLSGFYCGNSLDSLTERVHEKLQNFDLEDPGILQDPYGPLWYRYKSTPTFESHASGESVDAVLQRHGVRRVVVGHSPTPGIVWPQFGGKVVVIDTGISAAYGGYIAYLEITENGVMAGYPQGMLPLPTDREAELGYLQKVLEWGPDNPHLKARLERLSAPETIAPSENGTAEETVVEKISRVPPICGTS